MKRVALFLISDGIGGAEQVVSQTINGLNKYESIYLIVNNEIASFYKYLLPDSKILNIGDIYLHSKNKFRYFRYLLNNRIFNCIPWIIRFKSRKIIDYLVDNKINIVHSHLDYALYSSLHIKKGLNNIKIFHTVHGAFGLIENKLLKPSMDLSRINFSSVDKLIFVSHYNYDLYKIKNIPFHDYDIIYNGINYENNGIYFRPTKANKEFKILYVGGSKYVKGYDILVETIDLLRETNFENSFHMVILGPLTDNCELVTMIRQRGLEKFFKLIGYLDPPMHIDYFKSSDILFMPSRSEVLPIAAIEALSLDLPVIASSVGGLPEIIRHGENGLLGNNDPQEYCDFILDLITNYNTFLERARNYNLKMKPQFEAKNMCQKLLHIYS